MKSESPRTPRCIIIAGPNGAGKTTFAAEFLPKEAGIVHFVNADLIAGGLSPFQPESAAIAAGRLYLAELDRLAKARIDFAFETTLSGKISPSFEMLEGLGISHRNSFSQSFISPSCPSSYCSPCKTWRA